MSAVFKYISSVRFASVTAGSLAEAILFVHAAEEPALISGTDLRFASDDDKYGILEFHVAHG